ncbi:MAG: protocatechuate 3,4-dioxygenase subunit alpha [Alphaproteobacteria bacterium]|nr:protocatechuate 3,4-dioxygenase subunit alpha [Alphaproteobacteria bacterium]
MTKYIPTAGQTVGPFYNYALMRDGENDLTGGGKASGETVVIEGRVTEGSGAPVRDVLLEIWQANSHGRYNHPADDSDRGLDENFRGFGRTLSDEDGCFRFVTIKPGAVPAEGAGGSSVGESAAGGRTGGGNVWQAPHIAISIFASGLTRRLVTRLYFPGEDANATDPALSGIPEGDRERLIAKPGDGGGEKSIRFDIVLQGEGETPFFEE